ncbi:MAG: ABC transporter ATP-binding protein [Deltaproteobacteria bacterium]|nr:ABC transporter ATP-binding protein [Deltaproteobacteria bacterium]
MIRLVHLSKTYGGTVAVSDVNLHVQPGEVFGFIGPNGAGKTTTIKMMAGLLSPTKGSVFIDGVDMAKDPVRAKLKIGLIPDRPFLYEKLTAMEFLQFTAGLYHVAKQAFAEKSRELLGRFSLSDRADELIEAYSHGMKQRLIMCAALLHEPQLLIVDEPMVGLDPRGIKMVKELFRTLAQNGTTVFMSTHTLRLAEEVCDRIAIIHKGALMAIGTLQDLQQHIQNGDADLEQVFFEITQD